MIVPQIKVPHPWIYDPLDSARRISGVENAQRWVVTHAYGALSAELLDLEEIGERGRVLPDGVQTAYFDGAAHHQRFDFENLDSWIKEIQSAIPEDKQRFFYDGIIRVYTREHGRTPKAVLDFASELTEKTGVQDFANGIRIGIQQGFGDDIADAIDLSMSYPEPLHNTLMEELGWRLGTDHGLDVNQWSALKQGLTEQASCWLAEGMTRGRTLLTVGQAEDWWSEVTHFRSELGIDCGLEIASGVAEALLIVFGGSPESIEAQIEAIELQDDKDIVIEILDKKQSLTKEQQLDQMPAMPGADPNLPPL